MSPNNQNEYEIIDALSPTSVSDNSIRYPLANDQTNTLQNMNYKDYLKMTESTNAELSRNPGTFISAQDAVGTGIDIVSTIISGLGIPVLGEVFSILGSLIGLLWPSNNENVWQIFMNRVEELIDQKILDSVRSRAIADLANSRIAVEYYQNALEDWRKNPHSTRSAALVKERFGNAEAILRTNMGSFSQTNYETPLLPTYAQAASLHLLVMRDVQIYGKEWGYPQNDIDLFYKEQVSYTARYSDHCVQWYNAGLNKLRGTGAKQWVDYNRFRREMNVMVLDLVALFPNYDARIYPLETNAELTREIFTDPVGSYVTGQSSTLISWYDMIPAALPSFSTLENLLRKPDFFTLLQEIRMYTSFRQNGTIEYYNYWGGQRLTLSYIYGSSFNKYSGVLAGAEDIIPVGQNDIYRVVWTYIGRYTNSLLGVNPVTFYFSNNTPKTYSKPKQFAGGIKTIDSGEELTYENYQSYSHRVSYITSFEIKSTGGTVLGVVPIFGWTHSSASRNNFIYATKISQIPINKASRTSGGAVWNFQEGLYNGGPVMKLSGSGSQVINLRVATDAKGASQRYRIRIRYASDRAGKFTISSRSPENPATYSASIAYTNTMSTNASLTYSTFAYAESGPINLGISGSSRTFDISITKEAGAANLYIDRIEFIPVNTLFEAEEDLDVAKKAVNGLFTNEKDALQTSVTDYQVNQAANLIECLSDELYPNEKRMLWDAVKEAKRLVQARNLLQDTGFNRINGENGWTGSTGIEVVEGDVLFKDRSLRLTSAREIDTETYPTYLYQQIDESLLKPYTRYKLKGFIGSSQDLEIKLIRHRANQIVKNVPDNLLPDVRPVNSCGGVDRCSEQQYVDANLALENNGENGNMSSDSHAFSFHIDTGGIDLNENTGIWIVFKIPTTNGNATLGNLEFVEEGPLSGETLEWAQQQEQQWQDKMARKRAASEKTYYAAKQAIDRLFADYQDQKLNSGVEMSDLLAAQNLVQSIPYVYNDALPEIPGMNYTSFTELTNRLQQAWNLYDLQNAIPNGDFRNGLSNWNATSDVNVQQLSDTSVLVIPNWNSQVSQQFTVQPNYRYVLRVTARKEGVGDGYVIIRDGANQTETLTFNICDDDTGVLSTDQTSYITKTVEFTPSTEQVWIDMSETEGVFNIESVELVLEEEVDKLAAALEHHHHHH
ncbi:pesticidal crystal protein Cry8Ca [Bacillus thuringiensis]